MNRPFSDLFQTAPLPSHIMTNPALANVLRSLAQEGPAAFYRGRVAEGVFQFEQAGEPSGIDGSNVAIVEVVQEGGGCMSLDDLASATADVVRPIKYTFRGGNEVNNGVTLWEVSPEPPPQLTMFSVPPTARA